MYSIASFVNFMKTTQANQTLKVELVPPENYASNINKNDTVVFYVKLSSSSVGGQQGFLGVRYGNKGIMECPMLGNSFRDATGKVILSLKANTFLTRSARRLGYPFRTSYLRICRRRISRIFRRNYAILSSCGLGRTFRGWYFLGRKYFALGWLAELLCRTFQLSTCSTPGWRVCI